MDSALTGTHADTPVVPKVNGVWGCGFEGLAPPRNISIGFPEMAMEDPSILQMDPLLGHSEHNLIKAADIGFRRIPQGQ